MNCLNCGTPLELSAGPSGMLVCPKGDSKLISPHGRGGLVDVGKEAGVEYEHRNATETFEHGDQRRLFAIQGYSQVYRLARGQARNGRQVQALWQGKVRTFVPQ